MSTVDGRRRRLSADERRDVLIEAGSAVFAERGFHDAAAVEIAARAGVTKQLMYRHFPSKEAIYTAALERERINLVDVLAAAEGEDRIVRLIEAFFGYVETRPFARRAVREADAGDEIRAGQDELQAELRAAIRQALTAETTLLAGDPDRELGLDLMADGVRLTLTGMATWWVEHPERDRAEVVATATRLVLGGVAALRDG